MSHILQPKHTKLKQDEVEKLLKSLNISLSQLPKIKITDPALIDEEYNISDIVKIERHTDNKKSVYYRVVTI